MSTNAVDLTAMSAAEIKAFIESQNPPTEETVDEGQPRDEHGRFVSPQADSAVPPQADVVEGTEEAEPVVVEREIDLADGSGVQVFRGVGATEAEAYAALADELTAAQANATKKIRELAAPKPATPPTIDATPEDDFLFQQQLLDKPQATLDRVMDRKLEEYEKRKKAEQDAAAAEAKKVDAASDAFLAANADFYVCPQNGTRMVRALELEGLPPTTENLQKVYDSLKADGLITPKPNGVNGSTTVTRGRASGLSTRTSAVPPPPNTAVDTSKLSLDQLRELAGGYRYSY